MITFEKGTVTEEQLVDMTKDYPGIRYRKDKDGNFIAYINFFTITIDIFKNIKRKIKIG